MKILSTRSSLSEHNTNYEDAPIHFVPTMGALHDGHLSLVEKSIKAAQGDGGQVIVSIFVNPKQFNSESDLEAYPRNLKKDVDILSTTGCDAVFCPSVDEVYPTEREDNLTSSYRLGILGEVMEAVHRPGHFEGVCEVVYRLFELVRPNYVYMGEKDYQQLMIIRKMNTHFGWNIKIRECPTIRMASGVAMSSRNLRLTYSELNIASSLYKTMLWCRDNFKTTTVSRLILQAQQRLKDVEGLEIEYFEIRDERTFELMNEDARTKANDQYARCFVVGVINGVRLIDNMNIYHGS